MIPRIALAAAIALVAAGCGSDVPPARTGSQERLAWRPIGSWSGRGNSQTDSFPSESGSLRLRWETRNESPTSTGVFKVTLHSAISGRALTEAIFHKGTGRDTSYVREDPRVFFIVVDSANVDWSLSVEEAVVAAP